MLALLFQIMFPLDFRNYHRRKLTHYQLINLHWRSDSTHPRDTPRTGQPDDGGKYTRTSCFPW